MSDYNEHLISMAGGDGEIDVAEAKAAALEEAADRVMGPSDVLLDAATCRWIAMGLRESAAVIRAALEPTR